MNRRYVWPVALGVLLVLLLVACRDAAYFSAKGHWTVIQSPVSGQCYEIVDMNYSTALMGQVSCSLLEETP